MQIVIDIPDYDYKQIKEYYEKNDTVEAIYSYIYHGTPLPKHHGRMGDLDALETEMVNGINAETMKKVMKILHISTIWTIAWNV